jgi:hypothetical protein
MVEFRLGRRDGFARLTARPGKRPLVIPEGLEPHVDTIKQKSAELINLCEALKSKDARLAALAQTSYEEAAMWAVKAATA